MHVEELLGDHAFMKALCATMEDPLSIPFVNREEEVKALSITLIKNSLNSVWGTTDNHSYHLPFLPQMFGAGKTTIGVELLRQAKKYKDEILQELKRINLPFLPPHLEETIASMPEDKQTHIRAEMRSNLIAEQVDKFLGATYDREWEMRRIYMFWDEIHHLNKISIDLSVQESSQ